ncbi:TnsD family transposase [Paenibacillus thiaminolyticus]|uniref:TnsD family Tn7-like transposition protein n=1 Tax=Paenibacillus thiaminolyticus TaxID=49283 RepID=UPI00232DE6BB|nr:TnsD family Tn7-like transposition protein [Paenibacillus thiaminolyticus]WCF07759.1 TnsD family transposase [Paenibacillus thiaminolyticus]
MNERCELPLPYPDELLYSVVSRYHLRAGNSSAKCTLREVYGTENVIPTTDLPSHLDSLNAIQAVSEDQWIDNHTFYPYYAPFMPRDRALLLRQLMKSSDGSGIHALVGITASTVARSSHLHFCTACYEEDIERYGEPYWHRVHQLAGVKICPTHGYPLQRITSSMSDRHGLTALPISRDKFESIPIIINLNEHVKGQLLGIASDIQLLIQMKETQVFFNSRRLLMHRLSEMGLVTPGARVRQRKLQEQFVTFYGRDLLKMLECVPQQNDHSWLASTTRSMRYVVHPLRLMLLLRYLYGSFSEFLKRSDQELAPFGKGPWPCLNKAADHYRGAIIKECQSTRCSDTGQPVGTFRCTCGFSYSRRGPDQSEEDRFRRGRIKSFGSVWEARLKEYLKLGLSYRSTALNLGVDTNTVIKYANGNISGHKSNLKAPKLNKKAKRSSKPKEYRSVRVDWELRDLELSWQVEETCKELMNAKLKPIRIRVATVGKRIGKLSMLEKHKDKLPITMNTLSNYLETVSQFQIRRVRWAAEQMHDEWPLKRWKLIRKAGLRSGYSTEVDYEISRCISNDKVIPLLTSTEVTQWLH